MEVLFRITGVAKTDTEDVTETLTRGTLERVGDALLLYYVGADEETPELVTEHHITVTENRVEVIRTGAIQTTMIIETGELHRCEYATPFGLLLLDFRGERVNVGETESGVRVETAYEICIENVVVSTNSLTIEATPVE